ncbi:hypothetical protein [Sphingomonas sp. GM_Shp_1]|uniref:hypothetical protein n=1 Tax=Sphingomonas sp. GM_Shp_1 TaxID=2937381 RepID=UPI00226BBA5A|nr:hypothetical protein [Sphingomonas sp. GM_Shp_1]
MRRITGTLALAAALMLVAAPLAAQEKTGNRPGFTLAPGTATIVLMRPEIQAGSQSTGGSYEPNADWTDQARENLGKALAEAQGRLGNRVVSYVEPTGQGAAAAHEYRALFTALADSVITYQFFPGNRLPTKKRDDSFLWSIGPEIAKLPGLEGADYALFVTTEDHFGSTGRKLLQIFAAGVAGVGVSSGVHKGFAGLIDLKTGDLVWLNADLAMGGDVRTPEGASKRVAQLLEGFPGKPSEAATSAPTSIAAR